MQAQVPIVPVVTANYSNVLDVKKRVFNSGKIPVSVLAPVETKGMTKEDVDKLAEKVRGIMLEELERISVKAEEQGVADRSRVATGVRASGADLTR